MNLSSLLHSVPSSVELLVRSSRAKASKSRAAFTRFFFSARYERKETPPLGNAFLREQLFQIHDPTMKAATLVLLALFAQALSLQFWVVTVHNEVGSNLSLGNFTCNLPVRHKLPHSLRTGSSDFFVTQGDALSASFTYSASENQVSFNVDAPEGWSDLKATAEVTGETLIATTKPRCANLAASVNRCTIDFTLTKKN